jgi:hypothetical protein
MTKPRGHEEDGRRRKWGSKSEKALSLDSLLEFTGWHSDHPRHALKAASTFKLVRPRQRCAPRY